jgi:hypothetical protein
MRICRVIVWEITAHREKSSMYSLIRPYKVFGSKRNQCWLTRNSLSTHDLFSTCEDKIPIQCLSQPLNELSICPSDVNGGSTT